MSHAYMPYTFAQCFVWRASAILKQRWHLRSLAHSWEQLVFFSAFQLWCHHGIQPSPFDPCHYLMSLLWLPLSRLFILYEYPYVASLIIFTVSIICHPLLSKLFLFFFFIFRGNVLYELLFQALSVSYHWIPYAIWSSKWWFRLLRPE